MNTWYTKEDNTFHVLYEGKHYKRTSKSAFIELIQQLTPNMVLNALYA